jgi:basic membrane lipoprotein Med (substrate-binding protein (PBP1-ABC) superfamily)
MNRSEKKIVFGIVIIILFIVAIQQIVKIQKEKALEGGPLVKGMVKTTFIANGGKYITFTYSYKKKVYESEMRVSDNDHIQKHDSIILQISKKDPSGYIRFVKSITNR